MRKETKKTVAVTSAGKSSFARKKWMLIGLAVLLLILIIIVPIVEYYASLGEYTDKDGTVYTVKPVDGSYVILRADGSELTRTQDGYFVSDAGNLLSVGDDGYVTVEAVIDPDEGEDKIDGINTRVLMFEYISVSDLASVKVVNEHGEYEFLRNDKDNIYLGDHEGTAFDQELFSSLAVSCGYTLSLLRLDEETVNKYGLDEYGINDDCPYYEITTKKGASYKVKIGDRIPSNEGYYVQLEGRNRVYILSSALETTVLAPVENLLKPQVYYPMSLTTYYNVTDFTIFKTRFDADGNPIYDGGGKLERDVKVSFSYLDLAERMNTVNQAYPFLMVGGPLLGHSPSTESAMEALRSISQTEYLGVKKLGIDKESLEKYGLDVPEYSIYYEYKEEVKNQKDPSKTDVYRYRHNVSISKKNENGNYYAYSDVFVKINNGDYTFLPSYYQIVEIKESSLLFLEWDNIQWIERQYDQIIFDHTESIKLESPSYFAEFDFNHTREYNEEEKKIDINKTVINATDSFGEYVLDEKSFGADPSKSLLTWFKHFYITKMHTTIIGDPKMSEEEFAAIRADESAKLLTITVEVVSKADRLGFPKEYETREFTFYKYDELTVCLSVNGGAPFLVLADRVDIMIENAQKAVKGETIIDT